MWLHRGSTGNQDVSILPSSLQLFAHSSNQLVLVSVGLTHYHNSGGSQHTGGKSTHA